MPALSATVVQKALKVEATTIYARLSLNTAGTTATVITGSVAGGNPGASKGVNSTDTAYVSGQGYKIYLDSSIPVQQFLGAPTAILKNGNTAGADVSYLTRVYATGKDTVGSFVTIATSTAAAPGVIAAAASSAGQELWVTIPFTTSNVW
jgi:hypothetical protein